MAALGLESDLSKPFCAPLVSGDFCLSVFWSLQFKREVKKSQSPTLTKQVWVSGLAQRYPKVGCMDILDVIAVKRRLCLLSS